MQIQEYLIAAVHNLPALLNYGSQPKRTLSVMMEQVKGGVTKAIRVASYIKDLMINEVGPVMPTRFIYPWLSRVET